MESNQQLKKRKENSDQIQSLNNNLTKNPKDNSLKNMLLNDEVNTFINSLNFNFDFKNYSAKNIQKLDPVSILIYF